MAERIIGRPLHNFDDSQGELLNIPQSQWDPRSNTFSRGNDAGGGGGGIPSWMTTSQPANITSQGVSSAMGGAVPFAQNLFQDVAKNALSDWLNPRNLAALGLAGAGALQGLRQPAGSEQLEEIFKLAMERARASGPVFDQMNTMVQAQMPAYTRGQ